MGLFKINKHFRLSILNIETLEYLNIMLVKLPVHVTLHRSSNWEWYSFLVYHYKMAILQLDYPRTILPGEGGINFVPVNQLLNNGQQQQKGLTGG